MTRIRTVKTTFTSGEISRDLLGRGELRAYDNGALALRNVFINATGGVRRRAGLAYVDTIGSGGRLVAFEFNTAQTFLMVLSDKTLTVYRNGIKDAELSAPWQADQIDQIVWTQSADTLLLVHPDMPPRKVVRQADGSWAIKQWTFFTKDNVIFQPHFKFADSGLSLTPSGTSGTVTLTASDDVFSPEHIGVRLRVQEKEVEIVDFDSPTVVTVNVIQDLPDTSATIDWSEAAFSPARGYPATVAFHQDRLVLGGSRDLPNRLWLSKTGDLFNFDLGEGLDDEAIEFAVLSDEVNAIRGVFSASDLQIFTSGAEWIVTGDPLTPTTVQINRQTRIGSVVDRYIPPINVDGATLFVARNKQQIQEFLFTDLEQSYQTTDLALLAEHIVQDPVDLDFDQRRRLLFMVRADGNFASLTFNRAEKVAAWTLHHTEGKVHSTAVVGGAVFLLIERDGAFMIEELDDTLKLDAALTGSSDEATTSWSGLDHLEGRTVTVLGDGVVRGEFTVSGGAVELDSPAAQVEIGLAYTHIIKPLPPSAFSPTGSGRATRLVEAIFRVKDTAALRLDTGRGLRDIALRQFGEDAQLNTPPPNISEDVRVRAFGWQEDLSKPLWRIAQSTPLPFELLSVTTELKVND